MLDHIALFRLASQIEHLMQCGSTSGWHPADSMEFDRRLPNAAVVKPLSTAPSEGIAK